MEIFTAPYAVLVDAISFLGSGFFLLGIRKQEEAPVRETADGSKPSLWTELKEGLRFVLGNPNLRAQAGCTATSNFFSNVAFAIFLVFVGARARAVRGGDRDRLLGRRRSARSPPAFTAMRLSNRFGIGPTTIAVGMLWGPAMLLVAFAPVGNAAIPFLVASASSSRASRSSSTTSSR